MFQFLHVFETPTWALPTIVVKIIIKSSQASIVALIQNDPLIDVKINIFDSMLVSIVMVEINQVETRHQYNIKSLRARVSRLNNCS